MRPRDAFRWWLAGMGLLCLAAAVGGVLPLRGWLYDTLPPMRYFRHAAMFRCYYVFTVVMLAILAGRDLEENGRRPEDAPLETDRARVAGIGRRGPGDASSRFAWLRKARLQEPADGCCWPRCICCQSGAAWPCRLTLAWRNSHGAIRSVAAISCGCAFWTPCSPSSSASRRCTPIAEQSLAGRSKPPMSLRSIRPRGASIGRRRGLPGRNRR